MVVVMVMAIVVVAVLVVAVVVKVMMHTFFCLPPFDVRVLVQY